MQHSTPKKCLTRYLQINKKNRKTKLVIGTNSQTEKLQSQRFFKRATKMWKVLSLWSLTKKIILPSYDLFCIHNINLQIHLIFQRKRIRRTNAINANLQHNNIRCHSQEYFFYTNIKRIKIPLHNTKYILLLKSFSRFFFFFSCGEDP